VYWVLDPPHYPQIWKSGIIAQCGPFTINWKACVLLATGFLGGIFSAIAGSGIDICS
jgi:hypothetical protein